jgi:hypothetical protein
VPNRIVEERDYRGKVWKVDRLRKERRKRKLEIEINKG